MMQKGEKVVCYNGLKTFYENLKKEMVGVQQGKENAGKTMIVGPDGNLVLSQESGLGNIIAISETEIDAIMED